MNRRRSGLGSGLDALLPTDTTHRSIREVSVGAIRQNPRQPRTYFDETALEELAASIQEHGIIQPLIVSECPEGGFELIAGERRWRAAQRAGISQVPVIVRETTPQQLLELALIENVQRADLNPIEEAHAYQSLKQEFGLSDEQIAQRVGKNNRVTITNTRRLLKLPPQAQQALLKNTISAGHGRALLKLETQDQQQIALDGILADELNVREVELLGDLVKEFDGDIARALGTIRQRRTERAGAAVRPPPPAPRTTQVRSPEPHAADDAAITRELERLLGTPVKLARSDNELRVTIVFHTDDKLQEFFDILNAAH